MHSPIRLLKIGREQFGLLRVLAVFLFYFMLGQPLQAATLERDHAVDLVIVAKGDKPSEVPKLQDLKADDTDAFITVWEVPADDLSIYIPIYATSTYNYSISVEKDGDPSSIQSSTGQTSAFSYTVTEPGRYIVKIRGDFPHFYFEHTNQKNRDKLVEIKQWGTLKWESFAYAFQDARSLKSIPTTSPDLRLVKHMSYMFAGASAFNGDLSSWDVSNVTNMSAMFGGAIAFNGDLSEWDVLNVKDMSYMFYEAKTFNGDLSSWNVSQVTNMSYMFFRASAFKGNLSSWNVSNVKNMNSMFAYATAFNGDLSSWNVSNVINMSAMFQGATAFNQDLDSWNVSNVKFMSTMFAGASAFNGDLSRWNVSKVINMVAMFDGASAFNGDLSRWNVSKVENMSFIFAYATAFNGDLASWNVSLVKNMEYMFYGAKAFNQDLASWDVSQVSNMRTMLSGSGLSMLNYDKTLIGWAANPKGLKSNVVLGADGLKWCTAAAARAFLIDKMKWRISGDGQKCIQADANNILYVSKSGSRHGTGSSWKDALSELADALSWARTQADAGSGWEATDPLKIYVAVGTYKPLYHAADGKYTVDGQRHNSFVLVKNVQLYGGFDPINGYDFQQRVQPKAGLLLDNPQGTILSADMLKDDKVKEQNGALDFINYTDNAYHVLIAAGDLGEALVDGFVVQGGNADEKLNIEVNKETISSYRGGAMHITNGSPRLNALEIVYNKGGEAAGLFNIDAQPILTNLHIAYNHGIIAGGIYNIASNAYLTNVSLVHNKANVGAGMLNSDASPMVTNVTISMNQGYQAGAGVYNTFDAKPFFINSIIFGNTLEGNLPGLQNVGNIYQGNQGFSNPTFQHSLIEGDGQWNPDWGKDGEANDGQNIVTNLDPFMDRAQTDFRLKISSGAVDAGSMRLLWAALQKGDPLNFVGPMPELTDPRWGLDLAGAARILGGQVDIGAYEFSCPTVAPTADAQQSFCVDNVPTIASLMANGDAIKWYSAAYGGTLYLATEVLVDGQTYYASQTKDGCESQSRVAVEVKLIPLPDAPVVNAKQQLSYGDTPLALSATASIDCELRWYSVETGGTPSLQAPIPVSNVIGEQFFWVSQVSTTTGCEGPRARITVNISKAMPKLGALASLQKTYGDAPFTLSPPSSDSPGAFSYSSSATDVATVQDMEVTIIGAGSTRITVTQAATDYYKEATTSFDLLVDKAAISGVIFEDASYTYDGTAKSVELTGLPSGATVTYSNNRQINAGTYTATASINGGTNYVDQSLTAVLRIEKAAISAVIFKDASYTYDGTAKSVELSTALPSGASVSYSNSSHSDAGVYTATASINGGTNYVDQSLTAVLRIEKAAISAVLFKDASYTYDGTTKSVVLSTALPSDVTLSYSNNSHSDAGIYTATASINGGTNYVDQSLTAVLRIAQKQQLIRFETLAPVAKDAGLIRLGISSNSSLPIQLYSENTAVATVAADGLQIVGAGTSIIRAEQAGDANHLAAVPVTQLLEVTAVKDPIVGIRVHQALSPNGDGINDFLRIDGIDNYLENKLLIFDSNGTVIQTIVGYNNHSNYFDAAKGSKLMAKGTYFYTLSVKMDGTWHTEKGFFVLRY